MSAIRSRHKPAEGCPFCLGNGLIPPEKIVARGRWAVMAVEHSQAVPETRQIVPIWHEMTITRWLRFLWSFFWLMVRTRPRVSFNLNINFGRGAGQTLSHPHIWVIPRAGIYAGKGLAHFVSLEATVQRELSMTLAELFERYRGIE